MYSKIFFAILVTVTPTQQPVVKDPLVLKSSVDSVLCGIKVIETPEGRPGKGVAPMQ